jgi:hypothetical protein
MAPNKKALSRLLNLEGSILAENRRNIHANVLQTRSPSLNFTYGNGHGLPYGYTTLLYGPPRGGKSIISNDMIGWLHQSDPDAIAIKFNTEFRETAQLDDTQARMYGIDPDRIISYEVNQPDQVFDRIEKEIAAEIQDGLKCPLIVIDSLTGIQGRRGMNADSIMTQQIGDKALTIQEGLQRILPVQRKYNIGLVITSHIRAQMDAKTATPGTVHKSQTMAIKPAVSYGTQHHAEYYMYVEPRAGKEGRTDESGQSFIDESVTDARGEGEQMAHKVLVRMVDASFGPKGRSGMFTFDYHRGIVNQHEEVFNLGVNRNIIEKPTNLKYAFGNKEWVGKPAMLEALKNDTALQQAILTELKRRDMAGTLIKLPGE